MLSVSTIASLTSMFENWVFQYMSDPKHGSFAQIRRESSIATEDVTTITEANQMRKVMELQIYSLLRKKWVDDECRYVYQADPDTRLFLLTSITVGNKALKEVLNSEHTLITSCSTHSTPPINTISSTLSTRVIISTPVRTVLCIATYPPLASFYIDLQRPLLL